MPPRMIVAVLIIQTAERINIGEKTINQDEMIPAHFNNKKQNVLYNAYFNIFLSQFLYHGISHKQKHQKMSNN